MKLVAQMVGRDEANRFLPDVLSHLSGIVDTIVFTDDGSKDNTADLAEAYGAVVYRNDESMWEQNEGLFRQHAWSNLSKHVEVGDWIIAIDCDEKLYTTDPQIDIRRIMTKTNVDVVNIRFYHMWNETQYRVDKAWKPADSSRMFRFFAEGALKDRPLACGSEPTYVSDLIRKGRYLRDSGLVMKHLGYADDKDKKIKHERYMRLDAGEFHARAHLESILDTDPQLVDWPLQ